MSEPTIRERLRELAERASDAPWTLDEPDKGSDYYVMAEDFVTVAAVESGDANARLIVEAVNALPALLDELDTLERRAIAATEALDAAALHIITIGLPPGAETWRPEYDALLAQIDATLEASRGSA